MSPCGDLGPRSCAAWREAMGSSRMARWTFERAMNLTADHQLETPEALLAEAEREVYAGQAQRGLELAQRCWELIEHSGNLRLQANCQRLIGLGHERRGNPEDSVRAVYRSLSLYEQLGDRHGQARTLSLVGVQLATIGSSASALEHLERAISLAAQLQDPDTDFRVWNNLAVIYERMEDHAKAIAALQTALPKAKALGNPHMIKHAESALVVNQIYQCMRAPGADSAEAQREALESAVQGAAWHLEQCRLGGYDVMATTTAQGLADGYLALGRTGEAQAVLAEGLSKVLSTGQKGEETEFELKLGVVENKAGLRAQGMSRLARALRSAEELNRRDLQARCHQALSQANQDHGDLASALEHYQRYHQIQIGILRANASAHVQVMSIKLDIERTRLEAEILRLRAAELERTNRSLQVTAEQLSREALEDPLTGLGNRRYFEQRVVELRATSRAAVTIAIGDIDHFKRVNDNFSHATGDDVLREVGAMFRRCFRPHDIVARFGGEEFVVAIVGSTEAQAERALERLRATIEGHDWQNLRSGLAVTISLGLARLSLAGDIDAALQRADEALYAAKRAGRNRIVSSAD